MDFDKFAIFAITSNESYNMLYEVVINVMAANRF